MSWIITYPVPHVPDFGHLYKKENAKADKGVSLLLVPIELMNNKYVNIPNQVWFEVHFQFELEFHIHY